MINDTFMSTFTGFQYGVENLKSIILMLAITDKRLTVEKAVQLARLETLYQVNNTRWIDQSPKISEGAITSTHTGQIFSII